MGNQESQEHKLQGDQFKLTSHPALHCTTISKNGNLYLPVDLNIGIKAWWNTVQPLLQNSSSNIIAKHKNLQKNFGNQKEQNQDEHRRLKHLFIPVSIEQTNPYQDLGGCFNISLNSSNQQGKKILHIYYDCYVYTLENQIDSRRANQLYFRQWEVWKLLKNCSLALYQWNKLFPSAMLGNITPENIVMNNKGKIKIVNQLSFPHQYNRLNEQNSNKSFEKQNKSSRFSSPYNPLNPFNQTIINQINETKIFNPNHQNPHLVLKCQPYYGYCLQSIANTILQAMTLQKHPVSTMTKNQKINLMMDDSRYSFDLRTFLGQMLSPNLNMRPKLQTVIQYCRQKEKEIKQGVGK